MSKMVKKIFHFLRTFYSRKNKKAKVLGKEIQNQLVYIKIIRLNEFELS